MLKLSPLWQIWKERSGFCYEKGDFFFFFFKAEVSVCNCNKCLQYLFFFPLSIYVLMLIRRKGGFLSVHRSRSFLAAGGKMKLTQLTVVSLYLRHKRPFGTTGSQRPLGRCEFYSESRHFNWTNDGGQTANGWFEARTRMENVAMGS